MTISLYIVCNCIRTRCYRSYGHYLNITSQNNGLKIDGKIPLLVIFLSQWWSTFDFGDSDVGDIVMLVTDLRCWWQNHYVGDFLNVPKVLNLNVPRY